MKCDILMFEHFPATMLDVKRPANNFMKQFIEANQKPPPVIMARFGPFQFATRFQEMA